MATIQNFMERSESWRRQEEIQAIMAGNVNTSGTNKDVYEGLRGKIKPMPEHDFADENHQELTGDELVADADVNPQNLTDIGLGESTKVINQQKATETLDQAIENYGVNEVVEITVDRLLDRFVEQGIVYKDIANNVGFFHGEPKAFDVYDDSAFIIFDDIPEEMSDTDYWRFESAAPTMYQKFAEDIVNNSKQDSEEVISQLAEASRYLEDEIEDYTSFKDAFEYDPELQTTSS